MRKDEQRSSSKNTYTPEHSDTVRRNNMSRIDICPSRLTELGAQNTLANSPKKIYQHLDNSVVS